MPLLILNYDTLLFFPKMIPYLLLYLQGKFVGLEAMGSRQAQELKLLTHIFLRRSIVESQPEVGHLGRQLGGGGVLIEKY